ncbi:MAG: M28 family peptidase [Coriobacteriia bacterium]|nr:M28 family peptidase [Coriobacteriia bacterium]MBN2848006.1 M28 family peptidase [Coriobacteriia bacterium]
MSQVMEHVHQLADVIGPRPATTDAEAQAADYIEDVFTARGLDVERQEFDSPRTGGWPFVIIHLLTIGGAVLSMWWSLPGLLAALVGAVLLWLELDTRFSLARLLPKGPSQNIIARHVPRVRRGERLKCVVIVAHYDSAKASLAYSPGLVKHRALIVTLTLWLSVAVAVIVAFGALPFTAALKPWTGYVAVAVAVPLLLPLVFALHRELLAHAVDGANDNASGVAVMLSVMDAIVPESEQTHPRRAPVRRSAEEAYAAEVVPEDVLLEYRAAGELPAEQVAPVPEDAGGLTFDGLGDVDWETGPIETARPVPERTPTPPPAIAFEDEPDGTSSGRDDWRAEGTYRSAASASWNEPEDDESQERLDFGGADEAPPVPRPPESRSERAEPAADRTAGREGARGIREWLGVGAGFDVRKAGKDIGSWDNLDSDEEDEFGFKAGNAGGDVPLEIVSADEAARIRRRVTEGVDRALSEKEVWFVATGAQESGGWGMRALLDAYGDDLRDAFIINIDGVGAGTVSFVTEEGLVRRYRADRRLTAQAKRTARENTLSVKGRRLAGVLTDATPALARKFRVMSIVGFDINGRLPDWHWHTDTVEGVSEQTAEAAAGFVTALLREF